MVWATILMKIRRNLEAFGSRMGIKIQFFSITKTNSGKPKTI
jgi:hypothetical protein